MAFRISLNKAGKAAQLGAKAKAEEDAKAREEEHGDDKGVLGETEKDPEAEDVFVPTGSKRHFTGRPRSMKSGPGTLDAEPVPAFVRPGAPGGYVGAPRPRLGGAAAGQDKERSNENVYTTVVAKASNLPPAINPSRVEELFAEFPSLKVVKVERIPPSRPGSPSQRTRPSASMKVIFDRDASARDLDDAMNKMNDKKYLGKGYYLHLDRYLGGRSVSTKHHEEPFGATLHDVEVTKGYAPPPDLGGNSRDRMREEMMNKRMLVTANAPPDLPTLRLVHQTIEGVIEGGAEFEAALMQDHQVQSSERFAWLFNQKHPLNRYYRWRLHEILSSSSRPDVFQRHPDWRGPKEALMDEYAHELWDLNHPYEEDDSEDEDDMPAHARTTLPIGDDYPGRAHTGYGILPPRDRALLIWLLSTLPPSSALSDEIASFSNFAVDHVSKGMDEVVSLLVTNIFQPFFLSKANPKLSRGDVAEEEEARRRGQIPQLTTNALRIISDVALTTQKEPGMAYKYRGVIGNQLVDRKVFEYMERLPVQLEMGRLAENQYRDDVNAILKVWTDEHLFEKESLEHIEEAFNGRKREREQEEIERRAVEKRKAKKGAVPKRERAVGAEGDEGRMDVDGAADADTPDAGIDQGTPMEVESETLAQAAPVAEAPAAKEKKTTEPPEIPGETAAARARRLRPKAEDMFASDEE
jgi:U2-associated protein SR140